jgi:hypothetical protein
MGLMTGGAPHLAWPGTEATDVFVVFPLFIELSELAAAN